MEHGTDELRALLAALKVANAALMAVDLRALEDMTPSEDSYVLAFGVAPSEARNALRSLEQRLGAVIDDRDGEEAA